MFNSLLTNQTTVKMSRGLPPSPVLDFPPIRFMATASVECASMDILPKLIAPKISKSRVESPSKNFSSKKNHLSEYL